VILLHGWPDSWHLWREQINALAQRVTASLPRSSWIRESDQPEKVEDYSLGNLIGTSRRSWMSSRSGARRSWATTGGRRGVARRHLPPRTRRAIGSVSVGTVSVLRRRISAKQLSWYMLWFQFPAWPKVGSRERLGTLSQLGARRRARGSDDYMERQISDLARPGRLSAGFNWYRANISPDTSPGMVEA